MVATILNLSSLLLLLGSVQQTKGTEVFTILWKFPGLPIDSPIINQCGPIFQSVRDSLYKSFVLEIVAETNMTIRQVTTLDPDWNATVPTRQRQLLDNIVQDTRNDQLQYSHVQQPQQRLLQACKTDLCEDSAYIIRLSGCTSWCHRNGRLRNLRGEQRELDSSDDSSDDNRSMPVHQPVHQPVRQPVQQNINGDRNNIRWMKPGADTVHSVYSAIEQLPTYDPCRSRLLTLQYRIRFQDSSLMKCIDNL